MNRKERSAAEPEPKPGTNTFLTADDADNADQDRNTSDIRVISEIRGQLLSGATLKSS
ncbi:MAG: hypothetical protein HZA93_19850 [Verrucomicrobia bacterium]|nr:hypothetical protein [Verrucomicrobiota bacterium]